MPAPADPAFQQGLSLLRSGQAAAALPLLERAAAAAPRQAAPLHALAAALQQLGRHADAVARYRSALAASPADAGLATACARAMALAGDRDGALHLLDAVQRSGHGSAASAGLLGLLLRESGDADAACAVLGPAVAAFPDSPELRWELAQALAAAERTEEAMQHYAACARLRPGDALPALASGRLAAVRGDKTGAREFFEAALRIDPDSAAATWELANLSGFAIDAPLRTRADRLLQAGPPARTGLLLHDLLARADDAAGNHGDAAGHAAQANTLRRRLLEQSRRSYAPAAHVAEVDRLLAEFTPERFEALAGAGNPERTPVFVLGLPRSGTTLVERMLAAHPRIAGVGEQPLARQSLLRALQQAGSVAAIDATGLRAAADWHLEALRQRARRLAPERADADRIVDKLPDNYLLAGWIGLEFPGAVIVHCLRDPRDVAISCWLAQYEQMDWAVDLDWIVQRIEQHRRLMRHWRALLGPRLVELRYEALVDDPRAGSARLLDALGVAWSDKVMQSHRRTGQVRSASQMQVREPIHRRGIGRWRNYPEVLAPVRERLEAIVAGDARDAAD